MSEAQQPDTTEPEITEIGTPLARPTDAAKLHGDLSRARFDVAAARAGLDEEYLDEFHAKASAWLTDKELEPTRENFGKFLANQAAKKPKFFGSPVAPNTAPVSPNAPAAPTQGAVSTPYSQWRSLYEAGRKEEAEAFYRLHRRAIARHS